MDINLYPVRLEETLSVIKNGSALTVNGEDFDFSRMVDGDTLPAGAIASKWFFESVDTVDGDLTLTLILPIPANFSQEQAFPEPLMSVPDGPVALPQSLPQPVVSQEGRSDA